MDASQPQPLWCHEPFLKEIKQCSRCKSTKPISEFVKSYKKGSIAQYKSRCRECWNEYRRNRNKQIYKETGKYPRSKNYALHKRNARQRKSVVNGARGFIETGLGKVAVYHGGVDSRGRRIGTDNKYDKLAALNARQAWVWWLNSKASDSWVAAYYFGMGKPWNNPRISDAEKYKLRYNLDPEFQIKERLRRQYTKAVKRLRVSNLIGGALRKNGESKTVKRMFGYSIADLRKHIERQF